MPKVDFDFQRYVERRKGALAAQAREGAAYAYGGDLKVLHTLDKMRPVRISVEATVRLWGQAARAELLGSARRVTAKESPRLFAIVEKCAAALHIAPPTVYVASELGGLASGSFGTNEEAYLLLDKSLTDELTDPELADLIGRECGHLQNGHVVYLTALFYLTRFAGRFVRWVVKPATLALESWAKRAAITADRAGLLCARDLGVSEAVLRRLTGSAVEDADVAPPRVQALRLFAESAYFRGVIGETGGFDPAACDAKVAAVIK